MSNKLPFGWIGPLPGTGPLKLSLNTGQPTFPGDKWYVLVCRECGDPDDPLPMPFSSPAERGKWASEHTAGTGHDRWFVIDQPKGPSGPPALPTWPPQPLTVTVPLDSDEARQNAAMAAGFPYWEMLAAVAAAGDREKLTPRAEDRNGTEMFDDFPGGATLDDLEAYFARLRGRGAPGDAHPRVKLNDAGEITGMVCTVERHPEIGLPE